MKKNIQNTLAKIISIFVILTFISLSIFFINYEKSLYDRKVDAICKNIILGIYSIAKEAIIQDESSYIADYLKNMKTEDNPLKDIYIHSFTEGKNGLRLFFSSTTNKKEALYIKEQKILNQKNKIVYFEPIIWKVNKKEYYIGTIEVHFDKNMLYEIYYHSRNYLLAVIVISIILISLLMLFNLSLSKKLLLTLEQVRLLSLTDELTKIFNRKKINESLKEEINRYKRYKENFSIIMFDIDHFKKINDSFGHDIGDEVLKNVVKIVGSQLRITDIFGRWGGEEFIIISPKTRKEEAYHLSERIRKSVESFSFPVVKHVTISIGVTEFQNDENELILLKRVDDALYEAKETGRNKVVII